MSIATSLETQHRTDGTWIIAAGAAAGFLFSLIDYFTPHGPIADSWGALLVSVSTALMLITVLLMAMAAMPRWLVILFDVLVILDIAGTAVAAYFLEADLLLVFMAVALIGWMLHVLSGSPRLSKGA